MKRIICLTLSVVFAFAFMSFSVTAEEEAPYWYPEDTYGFEDFHGEDLPYVVDDADVLSDSEEAELSEMIEKIVNKYDIGYVIFTDDDNYDLPPSYYASDFLHYNGYGRGKDYSAVVFYLSLDPADRCWRTISIGGCQNIFTENVVYAIDELVDDSIRNKRDYFAAFKKHVGFVEELMSDIEKNPDWYKNGRVTEDFPVYDYIPRPAEWYFRILLSIGVGLIVGLIISAMRLSSLKKKMRVVSPVSASEYLVNDSYVLRDKSVDYLYTTVTKVAKPKNNSSSGGSSYSSGRSSGGSFSGGGRSF